jgi:RimJ/RimL family protein N-acetyltransferase
MHARHVEGLKAAARDGQLWKLWYTSVPAPEATLGYIERALKRRDEHAEMPFVIHEHKTNKVIGSSRFMNVDEPNRRLEIGCTWYAQTYQRTAMNTECKLLMLTHAFEQLNAIAVEFRTHFMNQPSRAAIERLGAKQDGILRNHQVIPGGGFRDTVIYSIIESEWPAVKTHLQFLLGE